MTSPSDAYSDYDSCGNHNGYYSSDNGMSEDSYAIGYNSDNDYDSECYESCPAESEERYECPVDMQQFGEHIEAQLEDVQAWEQNHDKITEIGIAIYDPRNQELSLAPNIKSFHMVIIENEHLRSGNFVPDNSKSFCGGNSWRFTEDQASWFCRVF